MRGMTASLVVITPLLILPFASSFTSTFTPTFLPTTTTKKSTTPKLSMALDPVTYLRTEWISAALCTNQTPRSADVALQLGTYDGRAVLFLPRTIRTLITSSLEPSGELKVSTKRQITQQVNSRFGKEEDLSGRLEVKTLEQRADDLKLVEDDSIDIVISLQSAGKMEKNGLDWKKSVREALRVLKPGTGRLLFVEKTELGYLDYLEEFEGDILEEVGYDDVNFILTPHVAGVALKSEDAGLTEEEKERKQKRMEQDMLAERSINAFERGSKKRKRKKKKVAAGEQEEEEESK